MKWKATSRLALLDIYRNIEIYIDKSPTSTLEKWLQALKKQLTG